MVRLLPFLLLTGCLAAQVNETSKEQLDDVAQRQLRTFERLHKLEDDVKQLSYFISHDKCFLTYSICLGEKKKESKQCWSEHQSCVIDVFHQWKDVPK